ncbi:MAG TPA: phosphoribosyltransferase family protein, partial [Aggregatilineales bacterium]|nr:phosphoribosyltransferase family protein [Aggregatilineales bacterium]
MQLRFEDRREAGQHLAERLSRYAGEDILVLGLPRGGVPVAYEVAKKLNAPLDIFTVRKLGVPGHEEYAMGAIASGGVRVLNDEALRELGITAAEIEDAIEEEQEELERRETLYRRDRPAPALEGRTVLLVDDGMATGAS